MEVVEANLVRAVVLWTEDGRLHVLVVRGRESQSISHIRVSSTALRCRHFWCDMSRYHKFFRFRSFYVFTRERYKVVIYIVLSKVILKM
jgi:hypothetical protein